MRRAATIIVAATVGMFGAASTAPSSGAAPEHRAGLVVDTGDATRTVVVHFTEESISGLELLQRAGATPVVRAYTGQGGAVCALLGVGHAADGDCLGSSDDPRYWAYHLAHRGATAWTYSPAAASSVTVHDGDVEGWKYGNGEPPAFRSFAQLSGVATSTTAGPTVPAPPTTVVTTPPPTATTAATSTTAITVAGTNASVPPKGITPKTARTSSSAPAASTTTVSPATIPSTGIPASDAPAPAEVVTRLADARNRSSGGGGSAGSLVAFAVVLLGLVAAVVTVRRRRSRGAGAA